MTPWITPRTESFWGMFIADSLAMPVHKFYDQKKIKEIYGDWIKEYTAPKQHYDTKLWKEPALEEEGLIGYWILQDKLPVWQKEDPTTHYHEGMSAGDTTLNLLASLEAVKVMADCDEDGSLTLVLLYSAVLRNYYRLFTTAGTHNDSYADDFHRNFFLHWARANTENEVGARLLSFARFRYNRADTAEENPEGLKPSISVIPITVPYVIMFVDKPEEECLAIATEATKLFYPVPEAYPFIDLFCSTLYRILNGGDLVTLVKDAMEDDLMKGKKEKIVKWAEEAKGITKGSEESIEHYIKATNDLGAGEDIECALAVTFLLALGFHDDFEAGVIMNANCGGENCYRGAALGALLGAHIGHTQPKEGIKRSLKLGMNSARDHIKRVASLFIDHPDW